ncbi:hypothetical protein [Caldivirga maquilingensis]|uniref:hypothetical protein n=1 Tax=Caldivirga maquilingensis TaxID=76887 RepID=UPI0012EAD429|nr:hypothetical protein [Caldivirga maquilingensis]
MVSRLVKASVGLTYVGSIAAGAFSTGVEIVHFFTYFGSLGVFSVILATILFTIFPVIGLEYARLTGFYDYGRFVKSLIGGGLFILFEIVYVALVALFISAVMAAGGQMLQSILGINQYYGLVMMYAVSITVITFGRRIVLGAEALLTIIKVSIITLATVAVIILSWGKVTYSLHHVINPSGWLNNPLGFLESPILYVSYNLVGLPAMASVAQDLGSRRDVTESSLIGGLTLGLMITLEYLATIGYYSLAINPSYQFANLPIYYALLYSKAPYGLIILYVAFLYIALLTALVGNVNSITYRAEVALRGRRGVRPIVTVIILTAATVIATSGLYYIVAVGYTYLSYAFLVLFTIPLASVGAYRVFIRRPRKVEGRYGD